MKKYVTKDLIFIGIIALFILGFKYGPDYLDSKFMGKKETGSWERKKAEGREPGIIRAVKFLEKQGKIDRQKHMAGLIQYKSLGPDIYGMMKEMHNTMALYSLEFDRSFYRDSVEELRGH